VAIVLTALVVSCSGGSKVPDSCVVKTSSGSCLNDSVCGAGAFCDTAASPATCVLAACLPAGAPCSKKEQCVSNTCSGGSSSSTEAGASGDAGADAGATSASGTCGGGTSEGGTTDAGKPNVCATKMNWIYDDLTANPAGFGLEACGAWASLESMAMATAAFNFQTPLAGEKLPASKPYMFSWTTATIPNAPDPGMDPNKTNGVGYIVSFIDVNTSKELLRVHTVNTNYTPDDAAWAKLTAVAMTPNAPGWQLKLYAMFFVDNTAPMGVTPIMPSQARLVLLDFTM
jgi:hypothetical protein